MASADFSFPLGTEISHGITHVDYGRLLDVSVYCLIIHNIGLVSDFYSSQPTFATSFLQIPPHGGHPCPSLTVPRLLGLFGISTL